MLRGHGCDQTQAEFLECRTEEKVILNKQLLMQRCLRKHAVQTEGCSVCTDVKDLKVFPHWINNFIPTDPGSGLSMAIF